ncbi:MAG: tetratricopeptide repeat protein [Chloroflexota bacterium]
MLKREYSWWRVGVVVLVYAAFMFIAAVFTLYLAYPATQTELLLAGIVSYGIVYGLRRLLPRMILRDHQSGVKQMQANNWKGALEAFEASVKFLRENRWLDQYRALTLLNSSKYSLLESDLNNIAACYMYMGKLSEAEAAYRNLLQEFPNNPTAQASLHQIEAFKNVGDNA